MTALPFTGRELSDLGGFPGGPVAKNPPENAAASGDMGSTAQSGRYP